MKKGYDKISVYERVHPIFEELLQSLETPQNELVVDEVEEYLNAKIIKYKENNFEKARKHTEGKYISCNLPMEKQRKMHGTKRFR